MAAPFLYVACKGRGSLVLFRLMILSVYNSRFTVPALPDACRLDFRLYVSRLTSDVSRVLSFS